MDLTPVADAAARWRRHHRLNFELLRVADDDRVTPTSRTPYTRAMLERDRACTRIRLRVQATATEPAMAMREALSVLHAASACPAVFHALWTPPNHLCTVVGGACRFCDAQDGGDPAATARPRVAVDLLVEGQEWQLDAPCFIDLIHNKGPDDGQFTLDPSATHSAISDEYRELRAVLERTCAERASPPPAPLELELNIARRLYDIPNDRDAYLARLTDVLRNGLVTRGSDASRVVITRLIDGHVPSNGGLITTLVPFQAQLVATGLPTELTLPSVRRDIYCRDEHVSPRRQWLEEIISLLEDPTARVVALRMAPPIGPVPKALARLATIVRTTMTSLRHLALNYTLSPSPDARREELTALDHALFSPASPVRLDTLELTLTPLVDDDVHVLNALADANAPSTHRDPSSPEQYRIQQLIWDLSDVSPSCARALARCFEACGIRALSIARHVGTLYTDWDLIASILAQWPSLAIVDDCAVRYTPVDAESTSTTWSQLDELQLLVRCIDSGQFTDLLASFLPRIGRKLRTLKLTPESGVRLDASVLSMLLDHCPQLSSLTITYADETFVAALVEAYASGRCKIGKLHLHKLPQGAELPIYDMLRQPKHLGTASVRRLQLNINCWHNNREYQLSQDNFERLLTTNVLLREVRANWMSSDRSARRCLSQRSEAYWIQRPSLRRCLAFLSATSPNAGVCFAPLPAEVTTHIFQFAGRLTRRAFV